MRTVEGLLKCRGAARAQIVWSFLALLLLTENCLCSYLKHSWINFEFPENELLEFYCCPVTVIVFYLVFLGHFCDTISMAQHILGILDKTFVTDCDK